MGAAEGELTMRRAGFNVVYGPVDSDCAGEPGSGSVVHQSPNPGALHSTLGHVVLQTSCPVKDDLARCAAAEIKVVASIDNNLELGDDRVYKGLGVGFLHTEGPPCRLTEQPTITVIEPDGSLAPLPGNPTTLSVDARLGVGGALGSGRLWESWCRRPRSRFKLVISVDGRLSTARIPGTPPCQGRSAQQIRTDDGFSRYVPRDAYAEQTELGAKLF